MLAVHGCTASKTVLVLLSEGSAQHAVILYITLLRLLYSSLGWSLWHRESFYATGSSQTHTKKATMQLSQEKAALWQA